MPAAPASAGDLSGRQLDGCERVGDVEVHFDASDWFLHGHESNPNFDRVCLHVLLYPSRSPLDPPRTSKGHVPETLSLLPILERDLEDYAVDDALLELEQVEDAEWMLKFLQHPLEARREILREGAQSRWTRKVDFSAKRLSGLSWREACHQYCLEVLGYARNRAPMSRLALCYSIEDFAGGHADADVLFAEEEASWKLSGLRPANHPRARLAQYAAICAANPDWPERLEKELRRCQSEGAPLSGAAFRKAHGMRGWLESIAGEVFADVLSEKRLCTLICDAALPLAQAAGIAEVYGYWMHCPAGDAPDVLYRFLKQSQIIDRSDPFSNGQLQGGLQLLIDR